MATEVDGGVASRPSRVVIVGAGAVGSHFAVSLRSGVPLLVVDSSEHVRAAFAARGILTLAPLEHKVWTGAVSGFQLFLRANSAAISESSSPN